MQPPSLAEPLTSPATPEWHARHAAENPPTLAALQEQLAAPSWRRADGRWYHSVTSPAPPCTVVARYCYAASCAALPGDAAAGPELASLAARERDFRVCFTHSVEGRQPAWASPPSGRKTPRRRGRKKKRPTPTLAPAE